MRAAGLLALVLPLVFSGCKKKEFCDRLVQLACDHVSDQTGGDQRCERLKAQSEHVDDETCRKTLRLLEEGGKTGGSQ